MNTAKIQTEVFKKLISSCPVQYSKADDCIYVTTDDVRAFRIDLKNICFNLDKCTEIPTLTDHFRLRENDKPLKVTKTMQQAPGYICVKLVSDDKSVSIWVNKSFLNEIGTTNFYGSYELSPVKHINIVTGKVDAILMPVRCSDEME